MRELPIPFNAPMVRAILEVRKTMTRRAATDLEFHGCLTGDCPHDYQYECDAALAKTCPYGQVGDRLWVREAWRVPEELDAMSGSEIAAKCMEAGYKRPWAPIRYEADEQFNHQWSWDHFSIGCARSNPGRYRHARFMPRWASRLTLEVTSVRVERLQDISEADAIAEGIIRQGEGWRGAPGLPWFASPIGAFRTLWESINGAGSWDSNPVVMVIGIRQAEQMRKAA